MKKKRMLLVVDPQVDFVSGSLPVPGAEEAMEMLSRYIKECDGEYSVKIITADSHPYDHQSFEDFGGEWPRHCVHDTVGAAIWPSVFESVYSTYGKSYVLHKGCNRDREEYSIFGNEESAATLGAIISYQDIGEIDICGLAGDVCVLSTLRDAIVRYPAIRINVLTEFSPSIDGGVSLAEFLKSRNLK